MTAPTTDVLGLAGARVLVTGAAGGIGSAVVAAFRGAGSTVLATDVASGDRVLPADLTSESQVERLMAAAGPVDHLVHAAGVVVTGSLAQTTPTEFRRVLEINLVSGFLLARCASPAIRPGGSITFIASQGARKGGALWSAYCASKFGLIGLSESLAQELAPQSVRVNAVCPGVVDTPVTRRLLDDLASQRASTAPAERQRYLGRIPMGRLADPSEIANVCVMLASSLSSYVTGASLVVDGGELS
ncbi:MAG TPA: SDR family oxidoreductase [Solirubrobacteraceae bacterium]|jgi:NAD(P)-dependent dehydrogenase (short-subunit alcohol dehydrogenase family)|nr:SDR family oxidoreductase [Solirubrobacteraceae bacterium]